MFAKVPYEHAGTKLLLKLVKFSEYNEVEILLMEKPNQFLVYDFDSVNISTPLSLLSDPLNSPNLGNQAKRFQDGLTSH